MSQQSLSGSKSLPEQAAEEIRNYMKEHHLTVGQKLPNEFQLAQICDVGRSTIREAVKILVFEGLVEVVRGSGTYLIEQKPAMEEDPMGFKDQTDLSKKALEFFEVRLMLEPEIAALAASNATYEDCRKLMELQEELEQCIYAKDNHLQTDIRFHTQIAECSKNSVVYNLMEIIVKGIPVFVEATRNSLANATIEHHRAIAEAIAAGDAIGARCAMIAHLNHNRNRILKAAAGHQL